MIMETMGVSCPPINPEIGQFLHIQHPEPGSIQNLLKKSQEDFQKVFNMFEEFKKRYRIASDRSKHPKKIGKHISQSSSNPDLLPVSNRNIKFLSDYAVHLHQKGDKMEAKLLTIMINDLSQAISFIKILIDQSVPVLVDLKGLHNSQLSRFKDEKYCSVLRKVSTIECKLCRVSTSYHNISVENMIQLLNEAQDLCLDHIGYSPPTPFEDMLALYMKDDDKEMIAKDLLGNNFKSMTDYFKYLNQIFFADNKRKKIVVKSALIRIIFSTLYLVSPILDLSSNNVLLAAEVIKKLTPRDLKVMQGVYPDDLYDSSMEIIYTKYESLLPIFQLTGTLTFHINPLDLAHNIWEMTMVIRDIVNSIKENALDGLTFDEFFAIFLSIFVYDPPLNAKGLSLLLELCTPIEISSSFNHATTTFIGIVNYLENFIKTPQTEELNEKIKLYLPQIQAENPTLS